MYAVNMGIWGANCPILNEGERGVNMSAFSDSRMFGRIGHIHCMCRITRHLFVGPNRKHITYKALNTAVAKEKELAEIISRACTHIYRHGGAQLLQDQGWVDSWSVVFVLTSARVKQRVSYPPC